MTGNGLLELDEAEICRRLRNGDGAIFFDAALKRLSQTEQRTIGDPSGVGIPELLLALSKFNFKKVHHERLSNVENLSTMFEELIDGWAGEIVLIFSMGSTGSGQITQTIKRNFPNSVVILSHSFGKPGMLERRPDKVAKAYFATCLCARSLNFKRKIKIATFVRDPISRLFSAYMYLSLARGQGAFSSDDFSVDQINFGIRDFMAFIERGGRSDFFSDQIRPCTGIDLFETPFDISRGYQIIHKRNVDLLVMRTEKINSRGVEALGEFLETKKEISLVGQSDTKVAQCSTSETLAYREFRKAVRIPGKMFDAIYDQRWVKHLLGAGEIRDAREKWRDNITG